MKAHKGGWSGRFWWLIPFVFLLSGCGGGGGGGTTSSVTPQTLTVTSNTDAVLAGGVDSATLTILAPDGANVNLAVTSGTADLSSLSVTTNGGSSTVTVTAPQAGAFTVTASATIDGALKTSATSITAVNSFSDIFTATPTGSATLLDPNTVQSGSSFGLTLVDNFHRTFNLQKAQLTDGTTVVYSTTDSLALNGGLISYNVSNPFAATYVTNVNLPINSGGFVWTYTLYDSVTGTQFTVSASYPGL